ncbi:MAG TPA: hypothetical protein VMD59_14140 [Acidimicrobiales bacterium]|nr:hypothetical protein [Acidimicrobiales bacterium]
MSRSATRQVAPEAKSLRLRLIIDLLHRRSWLLGVGGTVLAYLLQAVGPAFGNVALVEHEPSGTQAARPPSPSRHDRDPHGSADEGDHPPDGHSTPWAALICQHATDERDQPIARHLDEAIAPAQRELRPVPIELPRHGVGKRKLTRVQNVP